MSHITRRDIINGIVGTAALLGSASTAGAQPAPGDEHGTQPGDPQERGALQGQALKDFQLFIRLSAVLTGIQEGQLATTSVGTVNSAQVMESKFADPTNAHKLTYFKLASQHPTYAALTAAFNTALQSGPVADLKHLDDVGAQLLRTEGIAELSRSIVMAWYFGVWYEWPQNKKAGRPRFTVVSADAYTQGWVWRIAQAHPPGYSNLRFGYWAFEPSNAFDLGNFKLSVLST
jgi:hypothetical protein